MTDDDERKFEGFKIDKNIRVFIREVLEDMDAKPVVFVYEDKDGLKAVSTQHPNSNQMVKGCLEAVIQNAIIDIPPEQLS